MKDKIAKKIEDECVRQIDEMCLNAIKGFDELGTMHIVTKAIVLAKEIGQLQQQFSESGEDNFIVYGTTLKQTLEEKEIELDAITHYLETKRIY